MRATVLGIGSSPQARGTPGSPQRPIAMRRFIPAGAGNTPFVKVSSLTAAVHPRRRGEHQWHLIRSIPGAGSSPQARGTRTCRWLCSCSWRFIPAGAGNTSGAIPLFKALTVHPRRRGEHALCSAWPEHLPGSSPQARGTPAIRRAVLRRARFIPAGAGNTLDTDIGIGAMTVHPRRRGEHLPEDRRDNFDDGSSPQARGTLSESALLRKLVRFIPAGAGNTRRSLLQDRAKSVHPRRRGEHECVSVVDPSDAGSSPQARGTPLMGAVVTCSTRFIPAGAGNTRDSAAS